MQGKILFNKYEVIQPIGKGGTAEVYLVRNIKLGNYWAIKKVEKSQGTRHNLLAEPHILKGLNHNAIPKIIDIEEDEKYLYIIEEYIKGETIKAFRQRKGRIEEEELIDFGMQLCQVLHYLHRCPTPIIYQDLKPDNVIVTKEHQLKLIDFGIAKDLRSVDQQKMSLGTKGYAAPEQYTAQNIDERSDIYCLGMTLYYLATGIEPSRMQEIQPINYSNDLQAIIFKCIKSLQQERYQTVEDLMNNLLRLSYKKDYSRQGLNKGIVIGVTGVMPRMGVTHMAMALGRFLVSRGYKTIVKEHHEANTFSKIYDRYEDMLLQNNSFNFQGLRLMPWCEAISLLEVISQEHQYIILDLGVFDENIIKVLNFTDLQIVIAGGKDWELGALESLLMAVPNEYAIKYVFNFVDQELYRNIIKNMGKLACYKAAYHPDPFKLTELSEHLYSELLREVLLEATKPSFLKKLFFKE